MERLVNISFFIHLFFQYCKNINIISLHKKITAKISNSVTKRFHIEEYSKKSELKRLNYFLRFFIIMPELIYLVSN